MAGQQTQLTIRGIASDHHMLPMKTSSSGLGGPFVCGYSVKIIPLSLMQNLVWTRLHIADSLRSASCRCVGDAQVDLHFVHIDLHAHMVIQCTVCTARISRRVAHIVSGLSGHLTKLCIRTSAKICYFLLVFISIPTSGNSWPQLHNKTCEACIAP